jgi:hypothetical protein
MGKPGKDSSTAARAKAAKGKSSKRTFHETASSSRIGEIRGTRTPGTTSEEQSTPLRQRQPHSSTTGISHLRLQRLVGTIWYIMIPVQNATTCGTICCDVQDVKWKRARDVKGISDHNTGVVRKGRLKEKLRDRDLRATIDCRCNWQQARVA